MIVHGNVHKQCVKAIAQTYGKPGGNTNRRDRVISAVCLLIKSLYNHQKYGKR